MLNGAHGRHVDLVLGGDGAQVAQETDAVPGVDAHRNREELTARAPLDVNQALCLAAVDDVVAVGAVDRHAAGARDVADDLVAGHGVAAAGDLVRRSPVPRTLIV